ncbi:NEDD8-specific protease 1 [Argentina anserina]|uniref:NEDD8-specific protease 1 n=1 Tax=Argentina anserina TaxID=57926 RepID=UPI0021767382|nr:NEDD8-specific protease 1 [Potentilla anserina]
MAKSDPDEKILSYQDVVLRRSDLDILSGPYFLNDRIIEFYFSYLSSGSGEILLVPPSITFWIMNCPAESLKDFLDPLDFPNKKLVIFPVNDNDDVSEAEGGFHWSLLAFERSINTFVHHDSSLGGWNKRPAKRLYNAVKNFMGDSSSATDPVYKECTDSPNQVNGYDCGMYVLAITRILCSWYGSKDEDGDNLWFSAVKEQVTPSAVSAMRGEILDLIRGLMPNT